VPTYDPVAGLGRTWADNYRLSVQLVSLTQSGVPDGYHHDLDDFYRELDEGSASLKGGAARRIGDAAGHRRSTAHRTPTQSGFVMSASSRCAPLG
jgi:hypothetical protein